MKKILLLILLIGKITLTGQVTEILERADKIEIKNYFDLENVALEANEYRVVLHMDYGSGQIKNISSISSVQMGRLKAVKLFYSDFPKNKDFIRLNSNRIQNLIHYVSRVTDKQVEWSLIKQTDCTNASEASQLFHGFELILEFPKEMRLTTIELDTSFNDYVVERVLSRNQWKEMLIVSDMTGSMSPYIAQLFLWLKLNTLDDRIKQFIFFNDGNSTLDENKEIGKTEGIYQTKSRNYDAVELVAIQCMMSGNGGDMEENDLEALLKGIRLCPECKENVLIVDNNSPVRDLVLVNEIERPIRIIICGSGGTVNAEYLNIARITGGSIHLIEEDIFDLFKLNEGEEIELGGSLYRITNDRFVMIKKI